MPKPSESTLPDVTWLTTGEVADYLRVTKMTVNRMVKQGRLPAVRVRRQYRIDEEAVKAILSGDSPACQP